MSQAHTEAARNWVLVLTSVASFMVALDALVVTTALGAIRLDLGASIETLEWVVNAYNLSFAVLLLSGAALGDRFGRRRMFAAGLVVFVAASAACALSGSAAMLIAARAAQGVGAALVMPLAMALLSAAFPREQRGKALGIFGGITGLALIAGPVAGGAIATGFDWRWIFWINLPVGLAVLPLIGRIAESRGSDTALDFGGLALATGAALAVVWGLMRAANAGWTDGQVLVTLAIGALLAVAFVQYERLSRAPMIPMRLFASRGFAGGNAAGFALYAAMYGVVFFLPQFFQSAQGHDPLATGLRLLPWTATLFVFAPLGGALIRRIGERTLIVAGLTAQAIGFFWIALIATPNLPYASLVLPLILAGAGVSMAMPAVSNVVLSSVVAAEIGKASGTFNMLRYFAGAFGIALLAVAFTAHGAYAAPAAFSAGFAAVIGAAAALSLSGALAGMLLPGRRATQAPESSLLTKAEGIR